MDELLIILAEESVFSVELDGEQGIVDPPDPYEIAVANGYHGTKTEWFNHLFQHTEMVIPDLTTIYRLAKL